MPIEYKVKPNEKLELATHDPNDRSWLLEDGKNLKKELKMLRRKLIRLQQLLYAENRHKVLIVLQAMDSGGKDGTIRSIFKGVNPQGVKVANFKVPTPIELAHDYLWRVHSRTPATGEIVIFNRSHYEDVLVVRVRELAPEKVWKRRFQHIKEFERLLTDEGTTILKFFLNISKTEQKQRFLERISNATKNWKFNPGDLDERQYWDGYMDAYQDAIRRTSTSYAPWYIIPADDKPYRNFVIGQIIVEKLEKLKMKFPQPIEEIEKYAQILEKE
jgi:PPK2 family polyphosphate:nucleotide phosphotransferase